jgi:outer membrane receptor protein involved in Fe transport
MVDRQRQVDFSVSWQFNRRVQMVFEALNLNDEKYYVYQGARQLNAQYEQYGRTLRVGMKVSLF